MAAAIKDRNTPERQGELFDLTVAAESELFAGTIVAKSTAGTAVPASDDPQLVVQGMAKNYAAGGEKVTVKRGVFGFGNSAAADEITAADIGKVAYVVDDQTVAKTDGVGTRPVAGVIEDVDDTQVWVRLGNQRAGRRTTLTKLVSALQTAATHRVVSPCAGRIKKIWSVIDGALATGNATLTTSIGGVAVTDGLVTITQAASAAGDVDSATPSALNTVEAGDVIEIAVGGTNSAARNAEVTIEIEES